MLLSEPVSGRSWSVRPTDIVPDSDDISIKGSTKQRDVRKPLDVPLEPISGAVARAVCGDYTAEVFIKDADRSRNAIEPVDDSSHDGPVDDVKPVTTSRIEITDPSGVRETQQIQCLLCQVAMA